ncbi:MAG: diaminopimelate decarboxylase, partial [Polyangiales bacterium]
ERVSISGIPAPLGIARNGKGVLTSSGRPILELLAAAATGTPAYVYDLDAIGHSARGIVDALGRSGLCAYAIKANGAAPIVARLLREGCGIDCVSGGELRVALACGARPHAIVYSGVAKRDDELDLAIITGIRGIHVESVEEIERIASRARANGRSGVPIAMRINPAVEVDTHAHIATGHDEAKFGIARDDVPRALEALRLAGKEVRLVGLAVHIGSQNFQVEPYLAGLRVLCDFARTMRGRGIALQYLDAGGGFGVPYQDDQKAIPPAAFIHAALSELHARRLDDLSLLVEPGRALVAAHALLVARVIQPKRSMAGGQERRWLLIDAGMNDLIRPALYQAYHRIEPLTLDSKDTVQSWRVAGPICESSDDFGTHPLPDPPPQLVAIRDVGAYGRSMASSYNAGPLAAEVFVSGGEVVAVRHAHPIDDVVAEEMGASIAPD